MYKVTTSFDTGRLVPHADDFKWSSEPKNITFYVKNTKYISSFIKALQRPANGDSTSHFTATIDRLLSSIPKGYGSFIDGNLWVVSEAEQFLFASEDLNSVILFMTLNKLLDKADTTVLQLVNRIEYGHSK